jgi:hypothetical protein
MRKRAAIALCILSTACVSDTGGYVVPGETLDEDGVFYIVFSKDDERALYQVLQEDMASRGLRVLSGFADRMPDDATYLVEYGSQWQWDITWYLLSFNIRIYHPETKLLIATANSMHTSVVRRPAEEVVSETLDQLFGSRIHPEKRAKR